MARETLASLREKIEDLEKRHMMLDGQYTSARVKLVEAGNKISTIEKVSDAQQKHIDTQNNYINSLKDTIHEYRRKEVWVSEGSSTESLRRSLRAYKGDPSKEVRPIPRVDGKPHGEYTVTEKPPRKWFTW